MEKTTLCLHCRAEFTDKEIENAFACPSCGSNSIPGDLRDKHTLTLTGQEWRILFMWATNWAEGPCSKDGTNAKELMEVLRREAKKQAPDMPALSIAEELQEVVDNIPQVTKATLVNEHGTTEIKKQTRH